MTARRKIDPVQLRAALTAVRDWLLAPEPAVAPARADLAAAVRLSARTLENIAPGASVEVRVPPFVAVQCIAGPRHTRGTPPNVVETDPRTWLLLVTGAVTFEEAAAAGSLSTSGVRAAEIAHWLPLLRL
ncbi:sterol carrier family protein [Rhodococcus kronopolitis]|uniref:Sterol carrier family protein n=1 Tax=Rhodococcus kronopolitis TaxID=1460226 RepID=A0ABV9FPH9_9NOCA